MFKHSYTVEGRTYTACIECNRGINGAAENKCSSGGLETDERLGCWVGEPMGAPVTRYSWKVTDTGGNKLNLMYIDHLTGHEDNVLIELITPDDAKRAMAYGYIQEGLCPYFDFWYMKPKPIKTVPKPQKFLSTGIIVWLSNDKWWAALDMSNFKPCEPGAVEGHVTTRYGHKSLKYQIDVIVDTACVLGIEFWKEEGISPSVMYKDDGENIDCLSPNDWRKWRKIVNAETDRLGWCGYRYEENDNA